MSFSSKTKNEISRIDIDKSCCTVSELSALIRMIGSINIGGYHKINLKFSTENAAIARRIFSLLKTLYEIQPEIMVTRNRHLKKNNNYMMVVDNSEIANQILSDTGILSIKDDGLYKIDYNIDCKIIKISI